MRALQEDEFGAQLAERVRRDGYLLTGPGAPVPHVDWRSYPKLDKYTPKVRPMLIRLTHHKES